MPDDGRSSDRPSSIVDRRFLGAGRIEARKEE
jgi:hypothetical protein